MSLGAAAERWKAVWSQISDVSLPEWLMGVDLRSTAGNCAWARTPQLTHLCPRNAQPYTLSGSAFSTPKSIRSLYLMRPGLRTRRRWRRWPSEREGGGVPCEPDGRIECALARGSSHRLDG